MSEQTAGAVTSAADDVFRGENPSFEEFSRYRESGELPERFKPAEQAATAAADTPESTAAPEGEKPESGPESDPDKQQEKPAHPKTAKDRIAQLEAAVEREWQQDDPDLVKIGQYTATIEKIEQRAGIKRKTEPAPVSQPEQSKPTAIPQTYQDWEKAFSPETWLEEYAKANPEASYERANAAMFSHMLNVREQFTARDNAVRAEKQKLDATLEDARGRYENFDEVKDEFLGHMIQPDGTPIVPIPVLSLINDSPFLADLVFTIGSDEAELAKFVKMAKTNPNQAMRYVALTENLIREELGKKPEKTPAKTQTAAPRPPSPVGGGASRAFDVSDESLSPEEWMRKRNADLAKKGKA